MNLHMYGQIMFDKGAKYFNEERTVFSTNVARKTEHPQAKEIEIRCLSNTMYKINLRWIKDLKCKTSNYTTLRRKHRTKISQH